MHISCSILLLSTCAPFASTSLVTNRDASYACNNSPDLCIRPYSNITHLGAHNSPFISNGSFNSNSLISLTDAGNQDVNSTVQLTAGVRLLSAQVHKNNGAWHLCHTSCDLLDAGPLSSWLAEVKVWMDANPHDVVTVLLVNSDGASAADIDGEYVAANAKSLVYTPPPTQTALRTWPTLQDMITNNTRLVTFVASLKASNTAASYLLDEFTFVFENPFNVTSPSNFSCTADRPTMLQGQTAQAVSSGRLSLVNHFLYTDAGFGIQIPDTQNITSTNGVSGTGSLGEASDRCTDVYGKKPTFFLVDYFNRGSALEVVDNLNGINTTGRSLSPSTVSKAASSSATSSPSNAELISLHIWLVLIFAGSAMFWSSGLWS